MAPETRNPEDERPHAESERGETFLRYLREEVWPQAPAGAVGRPTTREEEAEILGYGLDGV